MAEETKIKDIEPIDTTKKLQEILQQVNPDVWLVGQLKSKGYSLNRIEEYFCNTYSLSEISYMLKQVIAVNHALAIQNPEMLRQLLVDEIDTIKHQLYETNAGIMTEKMANVLLRMVETKAKLLGLNTPEVHKVDFSTTIRIANEALTEKRNNFMKSQNIIDVTPNNINSQTKDN